MSALARPVLLGSLERQRKEPDIPVLHGVAVVLKQQWAGYPFLVVYRPRRGPRKFNVVVNNNAVVEHGHARVFLHVALFVQPGGAKDNVVGLPFGRGLAGIHQGRELAVEGAAVALARHLPAIGVEHLNLVAPGQG